MQSTILIVEDDADVAELLREALVRRGHSAVAVHAAADCIARLARSSVDLVITDVDLGGGGTGIELCEQIRREYPEVLSIVVTGAGNLDTAVAAIRAGAYDFVTKPVKLDALMIAVVRALQHLTLRREVRRLRTTTGALAQSGVVGASEPLKAVMDMVARVADSDATVLVTGESGTGKELVARALHDLSVRRKEPFVAINCAAMPGPLLESELFGHVRGAFTDARSSRVGLFVQAGGGTIFLDEIGEMPLDMQVKLLRVLQERVVRPVGGDAEIAVRARIVTATNRTLEVEVEEKRFREDLYYRINVVPIAVPPLRERAEDILVLAQHFVKRVGDRIRKTVLGLSTSAAQALLAYDWPGNVRELENCIERAVALCRLDEITIDDLPPRIVDFRSEKVVIEVGSLAELVTLDEMTRRYVRQVMQLAGGNKTAAARLLGIERRSLYRRLAEADAAEVLASAGAPIAAP